MDKDGKKGAVESPGEGDPVDTKETQHDSAINNNALILKMGLFALIEKKLSAVLEAVDAVEPTR